MSCEVISLFPTPLYISKIGKVTEGELQHVANLEYEVMESKNGEYSKDKYILSRPAFSRLKDEIDTHVGIYCHDVLKISKDVFFYMTNSWVVKHNPGDWGHNHIHTNSLISGVAYLQVNDTSGSLIFHADINNLLFPPTLDLEFTDTNLLNFKKMAVDPEPNMITLFPSKLQHSVDENKSNKTRYSLAFNYFIKGHIGTKEFELHLP